MCIGFGPIAATGRLRGCCILVLWDKAAREQLDKPHLDRKFKQDIPDAIWDLKTQAIYLFLEPPTERELSRTANICRLTKDSRNTIINASEKAAKQATLTCPVSVSDQLLYICPFRPYPWHYTKNLSLNLLVLTPVHASLCVSL